MHTRTLSLLLLIATLVLTVTAQPGAKPLTITPSNYESLKKYPTMLAVVYTEPCAMCDRLQPLLQQLGNSCGMLNATQYPALLAKLSHIWKKTNSPSATAPGMILFRYGIPQEYNGPMQAQQMVPYILKFAGPREIKTAQLKRDTLDKPTAIVFGYFKDPQSKDAIEFKKTAHIMQDDIAFAVTYDAKIARSVNLKDHGAFFIQKPFEKRVYYKPKESQKDKFTYDSFVAFYEANKNQLLNELRPENVANSVKDHKYIVLAVVKQEGSETQTFLRSIFALSKERQAVAKERDMYFAFIEATAGLKEYMNTLGVNDNELPTILVIDTAKNKQFIFPRSEKNIFDEQDVEKWFDNFLEGQLTPTIRSAPEPASNKGPVFELTANSYRSNVLDSTKTVLVEFYAPWCGHCQQLAPIFEQVALEFQDDPNILIAKLDGAANDVIDEEIKIQGFPTLYLYRTCVQGKRERVQYKGDRSLTSLIDFVAQNHKCE